MGAITGALKRPGTVSAECYASSLDGGASATAASDGAFGRRYGADAAAREEAAGTQLHPLTLRLSGGLEERFWREVGTPLYTASDPYALCMSIANV
jgi:hypothetical protein